MDSLSALKVSSSTNMPHANLLALTEPTYGGLPRMPSPQRPLRPPPLAVHASSSSPQLQPDSGAATPNGDAPLHELEGSPGGAGDGGSPQLPRPATSTIHLGEDAAAAMRTGQGEGTQGLALQCAVLYCAPLHCVLLWCGVSCHEPTASKQASTLTSL